MNLLITGATGYIGKNLIKELAKDNIIYCLARQKLEFKSNPNNIKWIISDLSKKDFCNDIPKVNVDVVIHLAQSKGYKEFPEKSIDMFNINIASTHFLLEWCRKNDVKKFIFTSTGNIYKSSPNFIKEDDECVPSSFYGISKKIAEDLINSYSSFFQVLILRLFSIYGPNQKEMIIPSMIQKIKNNEEITLAGSYGIFLSPLYIDDCIEMIKKALDSKKITGTYNLSGNQEISLAEIVNQICILYKIKPKIKITNNQPIHLKGSNTLFKQTFNYNPRFCFTNGLNEIYKSEEILYKVKKSMTNKNNSCS